MALSPFQFERGC